MAGVLAAAVPVPAALVPACVVAEVATCVDVLVVAAKVEVSPVGAGLADSEVDGAAGPLVEAAVVPVWLEVAVPGSGWATGRPRTRRLRRPGSRGCLPHRPLPP